MTTLTEDFEGAGPSGTDISTINTSATLIFKGGTGPVLKSDSTETPAGGASTLSQRSRTGSTSSGNFASSFYPFSSPTPDFDVVVFVRLNTFGAYALASGNSQAGSLAQNALIIVANTAFSIQATILIAGDGNIFFQTANPISASGHDWLKADGTIITDKQYVNAGTFLTAATDHKIRMVGDDTSFDIFVDDVKVNTVPIPVGGPTGNFNGVLVGTSRHIDDTWHDDLAYADAPTFGSAPKLVLAIP